MVNIIIDHEFYFRMTTVPCSAIGYKGRYCMGKLIVLKRKVRKVLHNSCELLFSADQLWDSHKVFPGPYHGELKGMPLTSSYKDMPYVWFGEGQD